MKPSPQQNDPNELIKFGTTLPAHLLKKLDDVATSERRSRSNMLAEIVERYLTAYETRGESPN